MYLVEGRKSGVKLRYLKWTYCSKYSFTLVKARSPQTRIWFHGPIAAIPNLKALYPPTSGLRALVPVAETPTAASAGKIPNPTTTSARAGEMPAPPPPPPPPRRTSSVPVRAVPDPVGVHVLPLRRPLLRPRRARPPREPHR